MDAVEPTPSSHDRIMSDKLDLRDVSIYSLFYGDNLDILDQVTTVLAWCNHVASFARSVLLTPIAPRKDPASEVIQIPNFDPYGVSVFITNTISLLANSGFIMQVHNDGFILDTGLWDRAFLEYDYIGAPWDDGVVGNQGFCIQSAKCLKAVNKLPFMPPGHNSDWWICRDHRPAMEGMGIKFAPVDIATRFATEMTHQDSPSFGFHGRQYQPKKHQAGWDQIKNWELSK